MDIKSIIGTDYLKADVLDRARQYSNDVSTDRGQDIAENRVQQQEENKGFNIDTNA